jgi:hypothetical protein
VNERYLSIYLNDHLAGATGGLALARRAAHNARVPAHADVLGRIASEIEEDRTQLLELMRRFQVRENRVKQAFGLLAERVGRLKGNGAMLGPSPLTPFVELEGLSLGIEGKLELWRALRDVAGNGDGGLGARLDELIDRAEAQRAAVEQLRHELGRELFGPEVGLRDEARP